MQCPRHPEKRTVVACKDCGAEFCIDCIRETDQTTYCPDCYRRRLNEMAQRYTSETEEKTAPAEVEPVSREAAPAGEEVPPGGEVAAPAAAGDMDGMKGREAPARRRGILGIGRGREQKAVEAEKPASEEKVGDFLSRGPDEDFGFLAEERRKTASEAPEAEREPAVRPKKTVGKRKAARAEAASRRRSARVEGKAAASEETLLEDVVTTLLRPEGEAAGEGGVSPAAGRGREPSRKRAGGASQRWSFLAQPRSAEYTVLTVSWWRSTLFVALVLLGGAVVWAVFNAYVFPKDTEYGIFAIFIGIAIGLILWWKTGKKHGTKLAIQAALITFFSLFVGEFLHWFLIVLKEKAFRTIFFDLISFKFLWENGAEILSKTAEAMFPGGFILILLLPTLIAFIIGFGMPPIPEIFLQIGHAIRGEPPR